MRPLLLSLISILLPIMAMVTATSKDKPFFNERAYPLLRFLSFLLKLSALAPVFFGFLAAFTTDGDSPGLLLLFVAAGCITGLLLFTAGEVIKVLADLAEFSRQRLNQLRAKDQD
ncbi:MAG: hypothetical protein CVU48_06380 [Candidatus Cloacimonetes bacterium HGW-Cloacimonetes-1]|jgi:hypothetical protein|nr:MAG: hypothetical protein CVU48_06380 [Candidatus Cloacimonetes bacterium HGW-Cloacimonetes-1]